MRYQMIPELIPVVITVQGAQHILQPGKWYQLNIVRFKYNCTYTMKGSKEKRYEFVVVTQWQTEKIHRLPSYRLQKFESWLLDNRRDVANANKAYGNEALTKAQEYSEEFINKKMEDIEIIDYNKDIMLQRTGESEEDLNTNTITNIG